MARTLTSILLLTLLLATSACTLQPVKAWEKGDLARPEMAFDVDATESAYQRHVYFSKEGSNGGATVGGGGCGCN
jgi:hypothetical protein